jgi:hypothetical protein
MNRSTRPGTPTSGSSPSLTRMESCSCFSPLPASTPSFDGVCWTGTPERVCDGRRFYGRHPHTRYRPPRFDQCIVSPDNVNHLLTSAGI